MYTRPKKVLPVVNNVRLILVINCGSSSLKFGLFNAEDMSLQYEGLANALNSDNPTLTIKHIEVSDKYEAQCTDHQDALNQIIGYLSDRIDLNRSLAGVGHRVVHGGEVFKQSTLINEDVIKQIESCIPLAPLHNPANLEGIKLSAKSFPGVPQIAVFDTAFHQTMPAHAYLYALPQKLYDELGVRRYGFHGSSHRYVSQAAERFLGLENGTGSFVSAHLGNGASVCAVSTGKSVDTSMGLTPLEGLVMGTRSGDIDPGIFDFLVTLGYSSAEINNLLNKESGLLGLSGVSNDMRTLSERASDGDTSSQLAIEIFCFRLAKYIAAMMTSLSTLDALIFTGGIGENAANVRARTLSHLTLLGYRIDPDKNESRSGLDVAPIHHETGHRILVIQTDEEKMIASDTLNLI